MVVPETANGITTTVSAQRSLEGSKGASFHTFSLPEDCCVRYWPRIYADKCLRISSVRRWTPLTFVSRVTYSPAPAVATRTPSNDLRPTSQFIVSVAWDHEVSWVRSRTKLCGLRVMVESYIVPKDHLQGKRCQRFCNKQQN